MATSDYTTAEGCQLDDFQCQICLGTLRACVTLKPCGHHWCATCLSQHFARQLQVSIILSSVTLDSSQLKPWHCDWYVHGQCPACMTQCEVSHCHYEVVLLPLLGCVCQLLAVFCDSMYDIHVGV